MANEQMEKFLAMLHAGGTWRYLWTPHTDDPKYHGTSLWSLVKNPLPPIPPAWQENSIYFGVHTCFAPGGPHSRTGADGQRLETANCLYADFDSKSFDNKIDAILDHLDMLLRKRNVMYPTATIASGGGIHAYWVFEKSVNLRKKHNRDRLTVWQKLWVEQVVNADPSAKDLSRVLRLPGTLNPKYTPPRPVEFIEFNPNRIFPLQHFADLLRPYIELDQERIKRRAEMPASPQPWSKILRWADHNAANGHRHHIALWLTYKLKESNCPQNIAQELITNFISAHITDRPTHHEAERMVHYVYNR